MLILIHKKSTELAFYPQLLMVSKAKKGLKTMVQRLKIICSHWGWAGHGHDANISTDPIITNY